MTIAAILMMDLVDLANQRRTTQPRLMLPASISNVVSVQEKIAGFVMTMSSRWTCLKVSMHSIGSRLLRQTFSKDRQRLSSAEAEVEVEAESVTTGRKIDAPEAIHAAFPTMDPVELLKRVAMILAETAASIAASTATVKIGATLPTRLVLPGNRLFKVRRR